MEIALTSAWIPNTETSNNNTGSFMVRKLLSPQVYFYIYKIYVTTVAKNQRNSSYIYKSKSCLSGDTALF